MIVILLLTLYFMSFRYCLMSSTLIVQLKEQNTGWSSQGASENGLPLIAPLRLENNCPHFVVIENLFYIKKASRQGTKIITMAHSKLQPYFNLKSKQIKGSMKPSAFLCVYKFWACIQHSLYHLYIRRHVYW